MADVMQNGTSSHAPPVDDAILLKFQRYRDRLRVLGAEGKHDELVAHYDTYAQSFSKVSCTLQKSNIQHACFIDDVYLHACFRFTSIVILCVSLDPGLDV